MIKNFFKVNRMLYRGSAPTPDDVVKLHKDLGIKKIISLDLQSGKNIQAICKELGIAHILIPVWGTDLEVISKFINANLMDLLMKAGPTFIHCLHGKDRTGMIIAMFRCKCQGWTYDEAIKEAKSFGFGTGLEPFVKRVYETAIKMCCEKEDDNSSLDSSMDSIVNNVSNEGAAFYENLNSINTFGDPHTSFVGFNIYEPGALKDTTLEPKPMHGAPSVGIYDNDCGIKGVGPVDNGGGFVDF